jgi:hypothetical protein
MFGNQLNAKLAYRKCVISVLMENACNEARYFFLKKCKANLSATKTSLIFLLKFRLKDFMHVTCFERKKL